MTFQFHGEYEDDFTEFYKERGCEVKLIDGVIWVVVPFVCPRLTDTGCRDYENRPYPCKVFDGRNHPIAKEFCKIE
jgi:Fe-S-cluster containining protein